MSAAAFFDAARALKRELTGGPDGLTQSEVDALQAIIGAWGPAAAAPANPTALSDAGTFFASVRQSFGALEQSQVAGFERLLQAYGVARWPLAFAAYGLATAWRETAKKMQPVREAYWLSEEWRKANLKYYPWYGRGDVQLTWQRNYARADEELGLGGAMVADPDVALRPDVSARVMVHGMEAGWFSGKRLLDYLPLSGRAGFDAYKQARRIINGTDAWEEIAKNAQQFEAALIAGGWR
jgi:putative chitinase